MAEDRTLPQTADDLRRAQERSLERTCPPTQVPGYVFERFLGAGAYGEVWVARDKNTGRQVAIKFYTHRGGLDWSLLSREVEKLSFLFADRYVVQLMDVGWEADPPYYVMEYLDNGSLADRLKNGPLPAAEATALFREIAVGLMHAHGKGVLHCDLKPANVLLDQDLHPRLADFGQSRMSDEQRPALGTLFYMAPEQANLKAMPDARWDVYGLGAVLYCMLTGQPPYRSEDAATIVSQGSDLSEQLQRYVSLLHDSPRPNKHRQVPGVGRDLSEILDRCLAINPSKRYPNPQAVLDALQARTQRRARRPLLVLGALGPAILLIVMSLFVWNSKDTSVKDSELALIDRALASDRFAARFVAETVAGQIDHSWYTLEEEASDPDLQHLVVAATGQPRTAPERIKLQQALDDLRKDHPDLTVSHWFLLDLHGNQLASSPLKESTIDQNFAFRDYFNGQGRDLDPGVKNVPPISAPHRAHVFVSKANDTPSLAFSVPIWGGKAGAPEEQVIGVLGITVGLGHFAVLRPEDTREKGLIAVLVDTRADDSKPPRPGLLLEHPGLIESVRQHTFPRIYLESAEVDQLIELRKAMREAKQRGQQAEIAALGVQEDYSDPVDGQYGGRWLAAFEPVIVAGRPMDVGDTGWVVIVQERFSDAVRPARELGKRLVETGLMALGVVAGVVTILWGVVIIVLNENPRFHFSRLLRRKAGLSRSVAPTGSSASEAGTGMSRDNIVPISAAEESPHDSAP